MESLGWWGGVKATIKLPPLLFLEVCSMITLLVILAKSPIPKNLAGALLGFGCSLLFALSLPLPLFILQLQFFSCLPLHPYHHGYLLLLLILLLYYIIFTNKLYDIRSIFNMIWDYLNYVEFLPLLLYCHHHHHHLFQHLLLLMGSHLVTCHPILWPA